VYVKVIVSHDYRTVVYDTALNQDSRAVVYEVDTRAVCGVLAHCVDCTCVVITDKSIKFARSQSCHVSRSTRSSSVVTLSRP